MIVKISLISFNSTPPTNICFVKKWKRRSIAAHDTLVQVTTQKVNHVAQLAENDLHHRRKYLAEPDLQRESRLPQTEFSDSSDSVESERTVGPDKTIGTDESEKPVNSKKWWTKWAITMGLATGLATVLAISAFKGILNWRSIRRVHGFEQTH